MLSVCIATYNGEKYIQQQLFSILQQIGDEDEVIISDDSSTDNTIKIIESLQDKRIKLYKNQKFKNPKFNFENALKYASGDIIFLSDQDDIWLDDKVSICLKYLSEYDLVLSNAYVVTESLIKKKILLPLDSNITGLLRNLVKNNYTGCCMAFNKNVLNMVLPFPSNIPMHDSWIGLVSELFFKPYFINIPLILYRRHGSNVSATSEKSRFSLLQQIDHRLTLFLCLMRKYLNII